MAFGLDLGNLIVHLRADDVQFNRTLLNAENRLKRTADKFSRIGRSMTMYVTAPIVALGAAATKSFASFDDAMTQSLAIMKDATPAMRQEMATLARDISKTSITSATNLAKSYFYLASAGFSAEQSIASLAAVEKFAVAGRFDMALATDLATDAQSALGLTVKDAQKNLENMTRVTDVLTGANTLANATVQQFSESLVRAGPAMKAFGIEIEEGTAVLSAFADQGKKGAMAGELFSRMLRLMIKGFIDNRAAWDRFGISIEDVDGSLRPIADIVRDLTRLLSDMGVVQKAATLQMLGFQARSQQAIMPLLGMGDAIEKYNELLIKMRGITKEIADKQLKSFSSQMRIMWHNVTDVARDIGGMLAPRIIRLNKYITKATDFWHSLNDSVKQNILYYAGLVAAIGPLLMATGLLIKSLSLVIGTVRVLVGWLGGLVAAMASPLIVVVALAAVAYVLRAAWVQNLDAIKDRMQEWYNAFKEGFDWLSGIVIDTVKYFAKSWIETFAFVRKEFSGFLSDIAGAWAGARAWLKGEDWATAFVGAKEKADVALAEFNKSVVSGYETTALHLKAYGEATVKHLEDLMDAVKTQFGEDADAIVALIRSKITTLQKIPISPHEQLRLIMETPERELEAVKEQVEAITTAAEDSVKPLTEGERTIERMLNALDHEYELLGKINDERERANKLARFEEVLIEEHGKDQEKINELMTQYADKLDKIMGGRRGFSAFMVQMKQWHNDATNMWQNFGEVATRALDNTADALANMVLRGKADFKSLAQSIIMDLTRMIIKARLAQIAMTLFPGLFSVPVTTPNVSPIFTSPHGGPAIGTAQYGGTVTKTGWAEIHEGETFSGVQKRNEGREEKIEVNINYTGRERHEVNVEESIGALKQQVLTITMDAMQHNVKYQKSVKQATR